MTAKSKNAKPRRPAAAPGTAKERKTSAPDWGPRFLARLAETANIREACLAACVGRSTVYQRRDREKTFALAMAHTLANAIEDAAERLERSALERALAGDTALTIFLLKAARPERYRDRYEVKHAGGVTLEIVEEIITVDSSGGGK